MVGRPRPPHVDAKWCTKHHRWECKSLRKNREQCHGTPGEGHQYCRMHAGISRDRYSQVTDYVHAFNGIAARVEDSAPEVDPATAIMGVLRMSVFRLRMLAGMVQDQIERDAVYDEQVRKVWPDQEDSRTVPGHGEASGIIGYTFGPAGITGEDVRALVKLEAEERDRVAKVAKMAHDMGIAEREIHLAESQASVVVSLINGVLLRLGLSAEQAARVPEAVSVEMRQLQLIPGEVA
jgi:hypothetical protein